MQSDGFRSLVVNEKRSPGWIFSAQLEDSVCTDLLVAHHQVLMIVGLAHDQEWVLSDNASLAAYFRKSSGGECLDLRALVIINLSDSILGNPMSNSSLVGLSHF